VKAWINRWLREVSFWRHVTPVIFKHVFGRWYVFRDTPMWVLEELELMYMVGDDLQRDDDTKGLYIALVNELELRRMER
jgi:hypothetical protein